MFTNFSKNKFRYEQGQMVPIFIIVLVVLIIMAMVSVNLSKVAMTKTYGANAADSGALAGGSTMASLFNGIAQSNSTLEAKYWMFYASFSVSFATALIKLAFAQTYANQATAAGIIATGAACCAAPIGLAKSGVANLAAVASAAELASFTKIIIALNLAVLGFWTGQYFTYLKIRETAKKQHNYAKGYSYTFAFANSGIGNKLRSGDPPEDVTDPDKKRDYQGSFSEFLTSISNLAKEDTPPDEYIYPWKDGQDRGHFVKINSTIEKPDTFDLQVCVFPLAVELADLASILGLGLSAKADMIAAGEAYRTAAKFFALAVIQCGKPFPDGYVAACNLSAAGQASAGVGNAAVLAAIALIPAMIALLVAAEAGLMPERSTKDSEGDALDIICWINDVKPWDNERFVTVHTHQHHEGTDLGLWQTAYPDIYSYSLVSFQGNIGQQGGQIYPPRMEFDSDIIDTDKLSTTGK
ncbi:MAG: Tad domain-containing protein [Candidatus Omnitrophica bacterium]|nr:Tad domain-containing protein [Candidatus Omnitrophota bacterium]